MDKTNKRVDVVMAHGNHPDDDYYSSGQPILQTVHQGRRTAKIMGKRVEVTRPIHDCPDHGDADQGIFRYDDRGDQICQSCGYIRNQDTSDVKNDHQHAGRYDGFSSGPAEASD